MTRRQAQQLAQQIKRDDEYMRVDGLRRYDGGGYAVEVTDERTGYALVINTPEDWEYRQMEAERQRHSMGLLGAGDIATLANTTANTVHQWAKRYPDFRALAHETSAGLIWHESDVLDWLRRTGRLPE